MATADDGVGRVRQAKEPGGFWVPNDLLDLHGRALGAKGLLVYCRLCRAATLRRYPSVHDLARVCRMSELLVRLLLGKLYRFGLLNAYDLRAMGVADPADLGAAGGEAGDEGDE